MTNTNHHTLTSSEMVNVFSDTDREMVNMLSARCEAINIKFRRWAL